MGREVRRVPPDWQHPKDAKGHWVPLHEPLVGSIDYFVEHLHGRAQWGRGLVKDYATGGWKPRGAEVAATWDEYSGEMSEDGRMPSWPPEARTHLQMYETCTEGTPISPVMPDAESLARWLADNAASAFGSDTATYEEWLGVCRGRAAPSAALTADGLVSGVKAMAKVAP